MATLPRPLLPAEAELLTRLRARQSDAAIRAAMGKTQNELLALTFSLRTKLGVGVGETIRDAAARQAVWS